MSLRNQAIGGTSVKNGWVVSYTQSDVDTIRTHIIEAETVKRRWLVLGILLTTAGLAGALVLLATSYALVARTQAARSELAQQNTELSARTKDVQQALDAKVARETQQARASADAQQRLQRLLPTVLGSSDLPVGEGGKFAQAVYQSGGRFETTTKPPDKLFRNWKVKTDSATEVYTVVGGSVDGKWVIYSNLVARIPSSLPGASRK